LFFLVARVKDNLKLRYRYEPMQNPLVVMCVLAVAETGDNVDFSVWQNTRYCPRACAKNRTTMSQQAVELIGEWLETQENETPSPSQQGKGDK
jgi:hypothetical protein